MKFTIFHPAGVFIQIFGGKSLKIMPKKMLQKSAIVVFLKKVAFSAP